MILTSQEIRLRLGGDIVIEPYNDQQLNPNSYNLKLYNELVTYLNPVLDCKKKNEYQTDTISPAGAILYPGQLYLGRTVEYTETRNLVPLLEGRSSLARLGMSVHLSAGFGDIGFCGCWTLEITVVKPLIIYPFMEVAQIFYHTLQGAVEKTYKSKYQGDRETRTSKLYEELR